MLKRLSVVLGRHAACRPQQRGAVAVEFALVLPILVMLLLGTVTAGVAYSRAVGLTNAVREGARSGATTLNNGSWEGTVVGRTNQTLFDDPSETYICAALMKNNGPSPAVPSTPLQWTATCAAGPTPSAPVVDSGKCVALVWATRHFRIDVGVFPPYEGDMRRQSAARYERTC